MNDLTPETIAELRGLLAEAPPLPYRYQEKAYGDPSNGPEYVALEAQHDGRWEEVATAHYEKWGGMGLALSSAAVNALPALLDAAERLAEVWDEGYIRGFDDRARLNQTLRDGATPNPYRTEGNAR